MQSNNDRSTADYASSLDQPSPDEWPKKSPRVLKLQGVPASRFRWNAPVWLPYATLHFLPDRASYPANQRSPAPNLAIPQPYIRASARSMELQATEAGTPRALRASRNPLVAARLG